MDKCKNKICGYSGWEESRVELERGGTGDSKILVTTGYEVSTASLSFAYVWIDIWNDTHQILMLLYVGSRF